MTPPSSLLIRSNSFLARSRPATLPFPNTCAEHPDWPRHRYHIFDHTEMDSDSVWAFPDVTSDAIAEEDRALYADRMNLTRVALVAKSQSEFHEGFREDPSELQVCGCGGVSSASLHWMAAREGMERRR